MPYGGAGVGPASRPGGGAGLPPVPGAFDRRPADAIAPKDGRYHEGPEPRGNLFRRFLCWVGILAK